MIIRIDTDDDFRPWSYDSSYNGELVWPISGHPCIKDKLITCLSGQAMPERSVPYKVEKNTITFLNQANSDTYILFRYNGKRIIF